MVIRSAFLSVLTVASAGCASFSPPAHHLEVNEVNVRYVEDRDLPHGVSGQARWYTVDGKRFCTIQLKEYPYALGHEMRHCLEGWWHGDRRNGEDF